jgi:hypothetical protein
MLKILADSDLKFNILPWKTAAVVAVAGGKNQKLRGGPARENGNGISVSERPEATLAARALRRLRKDPLTSLTPAVISAYARPLWLTSDLACSRLRV